MSMIKKTYRKTTKRVTKVNGKKKTYTRRYRKTTRTPKVAA